jgi:choline dehydrogenase-like flavoprotein
VTYAPLAVATGRCEIRTGSFATSILTERTRDGLRARGVRYRDTRGRLLEQDARVVVLAGGSVESPRLWLASGLPEALAVGGYLTTHWPDYVSGEFDRDIVMFEGQTSMVRCDFPGLGFIETQGLGPMMFAVSSFVGRRHAAPAHPFTTHGRLWGNALKRKMEAYRRTLLLVVCVDDDALPANGVRLAEVLADEHNRAPVIRYRPNAATEARREILVRKAADILLAAGARADSLHRADAFPSTVHQHGTLRMGTDPSKSVLDEAGEAHLVKRLFGGDTSAFANGIGGPNPTLTAQAIATRTAAKIVERYFT